MFGWPARTIERAGHLLSVKQLHDSFRIAQTGRGIGREYRFQGLQHFDWLVELCAQPGGDFYRKYSGG